MAKTHPGTGGGAKKLKARGISFTNYTGNVVGKGLKGAGTGTKALNAKAAQNKSKKSGGGSGGGAARKLKAKQPRM